MTLNENIYKIGIAYLKKELFSAEFHAFRMRFLAVFDTKSWVDVNLKNLKRIRFKKLVLLKTSTITEMYVYNVHFYYFIFLTNIIIFLKLFFIS